MELLASQLAFYQARASECDAWFLRQGRYDRGDAHKAQWFAEVEVLKDFKPHGDILELACGTGWWTERLAQYGDSLTAIDASPEVIDQNRRRLDDGRTFGIVKLFYEPEQLKAKLTALGWQSDVRQTETFFMRGFYTQNPLG